MLILASCSSNEQKTDSTESKKAKITITVKGSDTVLPVGQKTAENFMSSDSTTIISMVGGGSGVGISALLDGTTDIAMASRELKTEELLKFQDKKIDVKQSIIAYDALSVIVNKENTVKQLTREQLEDIFTGKITNWKEVGGEDMNIVVYTRESSSGTYEFFKEHVMEKKNYASNSLSVSSNGAIVQSVGQTKGAISYVGLAYVDNSINALAVSSDQGKTYVLPSLQAVKDKTYPISRPLYFFYSSASVNTVQPYVDYVLSAEGQAIVSEVGYIPVR